MTGTPTETPAATLQRAAEKIHALAEAATPGPWTATPRYRNGTTVIAHYDVRKPPRPGSNMPQETAISPAHAADVLYGIAMQPAVGVALADLLAQGADALEGAELHDSDPALRLARAILGEVAR